MGLSQIKHSSSSQIQCPSWYEKIKMSCLNFVWTFCRCDQCSSSTANVSWRTLLRYWKWCLNLDQEICCAGQTKLSTSFCLVSRSFVVISSFVLQVFAKFCKCCKYGLRILPVLKYLNYSLQASILSALLWIIFKFWKCNLEWNMIWSVYKVYNLTK